MTEMLTNDGVCFYIDDSDVPHIKNHPFSWRINSRDYASGPVAQKIIKTDKRRYRGERVNTAKLTEQQVREIRDLYSEGTPIDNLAEKYKISQSSIQNIVRRKSWRCVV